MDEEKLDPTFKVVSNLQTAEPARKIMNEIFNKHDIFDEEFINFCKGHEPVHIQRSEGLSNYSFEVKKLK